MPIYEYVCKSCKENLVVTRGFNDDEPEYKCSSCGKTMNRVYSSQIGVSFKGSGFYSTDK